jgi:hypothetical protein
MDGMEREGEIGSSPKAPRNGLWSDLAGGGGRWCPKAVPYEGRSGRPLRSWSLTEAHGASYLLTGARAGRRTCLSLRW